MAAACAERRLDDALRPVPWSDPAPFALYWLGAVSSGTIEGENVTPERWRQIKTILETTEEQPLARQRECVEAACGGDAELLREVESFLVYKDRLEGFIEEPVLAAVSRALDDFESLSAGARVGPYRIERLLGRGGMGAVYEAVRADDFEQRVALKLVATNAARAETMRRFRAERQILARLEHPNIARLLDGGATPEGVPYFAMELVEGQPIDRYCEQHGLDTRERLQLFLEVCSALQWAHQHLVVHRDLKPSNILVDENGVPKLLDFGIAKLLEQNVASEGEPTHSGLLAMTPSYASPEQVLGTPVRTASDVYSLGVVIYRVLTGRLPHELPDGNPLEVMRAVCEQEPQAPSLGAPKDRRKSLVGDVDAIVLKALRKRPDERYGSVQDLAEDLRRHLEGRPVLARQGTLAYRTSKLVRRHRVGLASLAAMLVLALGFTTALVFQLRATEKARQRAVGVSEFLIELFQEADPERPAGEAEPTVRELLDRGRRELETSFEQDPETRATLLLKLGEVYYRLGAYAEAKELLEKSIDLLRPLYGDAHPELATALSDLAAVYQKMGENAGAELLLTECIEIRSELGLNDELIKPRNGLAAILMERGELDKAEKIYRDNLESRRATLGDHHPDLTINLIGLAKVLEAKGSFAEADKLLMEALEIRSQHFGARSPPVARVLLAQAKVRRGQGRSDEAERLLAQALEIAREKLGAGNLQTALTEKELAEVLLERGDEAAARPLLEEARASFLRFRAPGDADIREIDALLEGLDPNKKP
ncbi:MAG: serine/threonine protein kinase [Thermoanaerobaculia bacterium]|nr:serine/threonine protein kinase [Thermoanaerobaculia bacterium]